VSVTMVDVQGT